MAATDAGTGFKKDEGKVRLELLPPEFIFAVGTILTFGSIKYPFRNWEHGMSWGRVFGALMRHLWAWWGGSQKTKTNFAFGDLDSETGYSHLWHAACCMAFLVTYEERQIGRDDRPSTTMEPEPPKAPDLTSVLNNLNTSASQTINSLAPTKPMVSYTGAGDPPETGATS